MSERASLQDQAAARGRLFAERAGARNAEQADGLDFQFGFDVVLVGERLDADGNVTTPGRAQHDPAKCLHALAGREPCAREYDPLPYPEAEPTPADWYAGTGVGALYDLPGSEAHSWQLAGWNVAPRSTR